MSSAHLFVLSLGSNTSLTRLNLRDNYLQDGGAVAICYAIQGKLFVLEGAYFHVYLSNS